MRIIFLEAVHNFGGSSKSTLELAKRLIGEGHQILMVDFWGSCLPYVENCQVEDVPLEVIDQRDSPIILREKNRFKTVINYIKYTNTTRYYRKRMRGIIEEFKPDLISVNGTKTLSILSPSHKYKIAYFARGWFLPHSISSIDKYLLKSHVDVFLTVSQATKQMVYASRIAKLDDIYVIPNAINMKRIEGALCSGDEMSKWYNSEEREFVIMHCGSFIETKGQHIAIEVLMKLIHLKVNVKLLLVGMISRTSMSNDYYNHIKELVKEYGLDEHVEFVVNKSDVMSYYPKSDLLIHPSYSEGLPRVVLEAMAFGKPVIGNAVGGMTDLISNNYTGYLTNFNKVDEYVDYIHHLIKNKPLYKFISDNASGLIKHGYNERNQSDAFRAIFTHED